MNPKSNKRRNTDDMSVGSAAIPSQGAYSVTLGPQEQQLYDEILAAYMAELDNPTPSERLAVIRLSLYEMRCRLEAIAGAPVDALDAGSRLLQREAKALQMTRESQAGSKSLGKTAAEVIQTLLERARDRRQGEIGTTAQGRLIEARAITTPLAPKDGEDDQSGEAVAAESKNNIAEHAAAVPAGRPSGDHPPAGNSAEDDFCDIF